MNKSRGRKFITLVVISFIVLFTTNVYANPVSVPADISGGFPIIIGFTFVLFLIVVSLLIIRNIKNGKYDDK